MNFRPRRPEQPELNLIPMIDVLIVLLIFLMLTTSFSREARLHISLPVAQDTSTATPPTEPGIQVVISPEGRYRINQKPLGSNDLKSVEKALKTAADDNPDPIITIDADRNTTHQSVITVLDAAGQLGYRRVTFAAQNPTTPH